MILKIKTPILHNKSVGISELLSIHDTITVRILYKDKAGNKLFPDFDVKGASLKSYPLMIRRGVKLRIVPIPKGKNE